MFQRYIKLLIIVLIIFPSISFAQLNKNPKQGKKSLPDGYFMEVGGRTSPDFRLIKVGVYSNSGWYTTMLSGELFNDDKVYAGASVGMRFHLPGKFTPFIGAHVFCGAHEETESADKDGIDNDEDGVIDEYGETKSTGKDYLVGIYPEAGFMFTVSDHVQLVISANIT